MSRWRRALRRVLGRPEPAQQRPVYATGALWRLDEALERDPALRKLPTVSLLRELAARLEAGDGLGFEDLPLAGRVDAALDAALDVHENRFAPRRYLDLTGVLFAALPPAALANAHVLEVGCGTQNPFAMAFLMLACGARRVVVTDIDPIQDPAVAARAIARCAAVLLVEPERVLGVHAPPRDVLLRNLEAFDLARLARGDAGAVPAARLEFRRETIAELALEDGSMDVVTSVSVLEHLADVPEAVRALARVTRAGGHGLHVLDGADHRFYLGEVDSQHEFLKETSGAPLLHGSNRLRGPQVAQLFAEGGFEVDSARELRHVPLRPGERERFVEPFRSMPTEALEAVCVLLKVRRRP